MTGSGLARLLPIDHVRVDVDVPDWTAAVRAVGRPMVDSGTVEPRYVDAMIEAARTLGPYIVIAPGLALPHAAHESGSLSAGLALITLRRPVEFGHAKNDPVEVVLALSSGDPGAHVAQLAAVSRRIGALLALGEGWRPLTTVSTPERAREVFLGTADREGVLA